MKCGICHKDTLANGSPIHNAYFLDIHKQQEHPAELKAAQVKQRATREAKGLREARIASAIAAAAAQATGVVLRKYSTDAPKLQNSIAGFNPANILFMYRVAEPGCYAHWQDLVVDAAEALEQAYQQGRPITEADVERVRLAVAEARQKAEKEAQP